MANIYNESMLDLYNAKQLPLSKYRTKYDGVKVYSKNCSYGYAFYCPDKNKFDWTLGYEGLMVISEKFKIGNFSTYDERENNQTKYEEFLKSAGLKYDWYRKVDWRTKQGKETKKNLLKYVMAYFFI